MAEVSPWQPIGYVGGALRRIGLGVTPNPKFRQLLDAQFGGCRCRHFSWR